MIGLSTLMTFLENFLWVWFDLKVKIQSKKQNYSIFENYF